MLGQLLHSLNPTRRQSARSQDVLSQIEDVHTKGLLFPDVPFLREPDVTSPATPTSEPPDCHLPSDLDLDAKRDVRILIAQGETLSLQPLLLFDSKHDPNVDLPKPKHIRTNSKGDGVSNHVRTASGPSRQYGRPPQIASIPENNGRESPSTASSTVPLPSPQRSRFRRSSLPAAPNAEIATSIRQRDSDEIVKVALECMFENAPTTYKGISNKIKIVQRESRPYDSAICRDTFGSSNANVLNQRPPNSRKPSTLSSSITASESIPETRKSNAALDEGSRADAPRRTVLVTRTFSVKWTEEEIPSSNSDPSDAEKGSPDLTVPAIVEEQVTNGPPISPSKPRKLPPRPVAKPPMFAITMIVSLPVSTSEASRPTSRSGGFRRKGSEALTDWTSLGSSYDSGFVMDPLFGLESSTASLSSDVDDRVDKVIGQHWDIIVRTLSSIQQLAEERITSQLTAITQRGRPPKLLLHALALDTSLIKAADQACHRVVRGIRILRVRTGQGRWGVWRDEARWLSKWTSDRDKTFLFHLCTAFLGTHTEWLDIAGPKYYRQQHREQLRIRTPQEPTVPHRTVIVSSDKMIARRLVFLLAAFLPTNHQIPGDTSPLRPSTSASVRGFSQSPPTHLSLSREEPLRRTINRRAGKRSSSRQTAGSRTPQPLISHSDVSDKIETATLRDSDSIAHSRCASLDLRAMINPKLAIVDGDNVAKSVATTSPTVDPNSTMPIAHIGYQRKYSSGQDAPLRPNSRDSLASEHLMQTLQRSNTGNSPDSQSLSRWGSLRSLWSVGSRRNSLTDYSDVTQNDDEGLGIIGLQQSDQGHGRLQRMVDELENESMRAQSSQLRESITSPRGLKMPEIRSPDADLQHASSSSSQPIDVPLKMSVNEQDGVIDVEFPGFSPINSPPAIGDQSGSSFGSLGRTRAFVPTAPRDTGHAMNVAGWLRVGVHPDFELQATPSYPTLEEDLKAAMRTEPSPTIYRVLPDGEAREEWVEVCTSIVADATNFTIKRLRLKRHVRYIPPSPPVMTPMALPRRGLKMPIRSQYGNPYDDQLQQMPTQITLEEIFEEEKVTDHDKALMDALERVIAHSGPSSKISSTASSRANSVRGRNQLSGLAVDDRLDALEVPHNECKKMVIGALEQIATAVERERRDAKKYGGARLRVMHDEAESSLRAGIVKWYEEVERNRKAIEAQRSELLKEVTGRTGHINDDTASLLTLRAPKPHVKTSNGAKPNIYVHVPFETKVEPQIMRLTHSTPVETTTS